MRGDAGRRGAQNATENAVEAPQGPARPLRSGSPGARRAGTRRPLRGEGTQSRPEKRKLEMCAQSPFWSLLLSALKGPALFITDQLIPAGRPGRGELGSPQGLGLGWAAKGSRASPGRWRRELRARRMCWRVSRGARPKGRRLYRSGLIGCLRPGAPALELPHTVSVFGLQLSCSGKVDSEVMILNAAQLNSNFKKLHILELKRRKSCHPEIEEGNFSIGPNDEQKNPFMILYMQLQPCLHVCFISA